MRSLALAMIMHKKIVTTETRAKALRPMIEKLVTRARGAKQSDIRTLSSRLGNQPRATKKLIALAEAYKGRAGGYTRITKLGKRSARGDASPIALIEFIDAK